MLEYIEMIFGKEFTLRVKTDSIDGIPNCAMIYLTPEIFSDKPTMLSFISMNISLELDSSEHKFILDFLMGLEKSAKTVRVYGKEYTEKKSYTEEQEKNKLRRKQEDIELSRIPKRKIQNSIQELEL